MIPQPDAKAAMEWDRMLRFIGEHGVSLEASAMVEDFIDRHADDFVEKIEAEAGRSRAFAELVAMAHLGDMSGPGVERVARLQDQLNEDGDFSISRWRGWATFSSTEESS